MKRSFPTNSNKKMPLSSAAMVLLLAGSVAGCNGDEIGGSGSSDESGSQEGGSQEGGDGDGDPEPEPEPEGERITGIGVGGGTDELTYEGVDSLEMEAWGPAAYVVDHLGLNWLADGPGHKILVIDDDGQIVDRYDLEGLVRGVQDIAVTQTHVYVLTVGGAEPVIARAGRNDVAASAWETYSIPADNLDLHEVTGLRENPDGSISVELVFGREHLPLFSADGNVIAAPGTPTGVYQVDGHSIELTGYTGEADDDPSQGSLIVDDVEVASIQTVGMLGDFALLGVTPDADVWLRVADVGMVDGAFVTQMFGYRFALDGTLEEVVQMPMREEIVWVEHRIAMDPEGTLRVLSAGPDEASILEAAPIDRSAPRELPAGVAPYLPGAEVPTTTGANAPIQAPAPMPVGDESVCMTRSEMMLRATAYATYHAIYNNNHMKTCAGRTPLAYFQAHLGAPGIMGVAYKYGGHIEVSTYNDAVKSNKTVGDLNTKTDKVFDGCSFGVDCSGFVSKVWRSGHYTTSSLHQVSTNINSYEDLRPGDALNSAGSHVRLVVHNHGGAGVTIAESTVGKERMRVVVRLMSWGDAGYWAGYSPMRYNKVCPDAAPPAPVPAPPPPPPPPASTHVLFDVSGYLPANSGYVPVGPARILDTRLNGQEHFGPLPPDEVMEVTVAGRAGLPAANQIGAVVLNITVAKPQGGGWLTVNPDDAESATSNINFYEQESTPGLVIIEPGADGTIHLHHGSTDFTNNAGGHIVVDTFGYFPPDADIHMVTPARVFDSQLMQYGAAMLPAGTTDVQLAGVGGIPIGDEVGAVIANVTAVKPSGSGWATVHEAGQPQPVTSNLNYTANYTRANLVIIPVSHAGLASIYTEKSSHYIVDVLGWFGAGVDFEPISPLRLRDTRTDDLPLGHEGWLSIDAAGMPTIPDDVVAIFGNLTAVNPTALGFLQVYPDPLLVPLTSNANFNGGKTVANAVLTEVSPTGYINVKVNLPTP